ncbi:hypothetical protein M501DRAFT_988146 [Patellaria atrata CBS 101060]|uniref:Uncharacterized protein n=1 Tax=Patellaria atrata CBS 101060 TaxID=1346257 RepID=A0A9P4SHF6_9PEZI|nr:hypothetical protein M501DRAFT_988146 [Patellaria atrata CBS 101060]
MLLFRVLISTAFGAVVVIAESFKRLAPRGYVSVCNTTSTEQTPTKYLYESYQSPSPRPTYHTSYPYNNFTRPPSYSSSLIDNGRCVPDCIINVPQAALRWWHPYPLDYVAAEVGIARDEDGNIIGERLIPVDTPFNVSHALALPIAVPILSWDPLVNSTVDSFSFYSGRPVAASTAIVTKSAVLPIPTTVPQTSLETLLIDPPPRASTVLDIASNSSLVITSATPFVYYSAYEVFNQIPVTDADGSVRCESVTNTYHLPRLYPYEIPGDQDFDGQITVTGPVDSNFVANIPQSTCRPGKFKAPSTVLVVVNVIYNTYVPFIVHQESSEVIVDLPTLPPGPEAEPSSTWMPCTSCPHKAHGESRESLVDFPTRTLHSISREPIPQFAHGEFTESFFDVPTDVPRQTGPNINISFESSVTTSSQGSLYTWTLFLPTVHGEWSEDGVDLPTNPAGSDSSTVTGGILSNVIANDLTSTHMPTLTPSPSVILTEATLFPSGIAIGTQFVVPGGSPITVEGVPISLPPSATAVVIDGVTTPLPHFTWDLAPTRPSFPRPSPTPNRRPAINIGGKIITPEPGTAFIIGGHTIPVSRSVKSIVINGATRILSTPPLITRPPALVFDGTVITAVGTSFIIDDQTLVPGSAITVDSTFVYLPPFGSTVIIGDVTQTLAGATTITPAPVLSADGTLYSLQNNSPIYVVSDQTLTPGGIITVYGSEVSLLPSATAVVIDGTTSLIDGSHGARTIATDPPLLTVDGQTYSANAGMAYIIAGQTLTPGGEITVEGTTIGLSPSANVLVVNGTPSTLSPETITLSKASSSPIALRTTVARLPSRTGSAVVRPTGEGSASQQAQLTYSHVLIVITFILFFGFI